MDPERRSVRTRIRASTAEFVRGATAVKIPLRWRLGYWRAYIALARRGEMVHSSERDAVYKDGPLKQRYDSWCERINRHLERASPPACPIEVPSFPLGELEIADLRLLMKLNVPFVVRGGARALPVGSWTLDYLEEVAGACAVPINEAPDRPSDDLSRPTKAHHYYDFRTGTLAEVVQGIRAGRNLRITTAEDVMHHDGGRLRRDLDLPWFEQWTGWARNQHHWLRSRLFVGKIVGAQLLMQPDNAFTLWHAEPGDNFFVLAKGRKTWTMAHPYYTAALRPRVKSTTNYAGSNIDVRESEDALQRRGYEGYIHMPKVQVFLQPGDILRVPNYWWHTVVTHPGSYTLAATIRSNSPPNRLCPGYTMLRLLDTQYHAMARAFATEGRIHDSHIGYPRKPREGAARS
jgi:hypothetical protein